jgi:hypothetical protein
LSRKKTHFLANGFAARLFFAGGAAETSRSNPALLFRTPGAAAESKSPADAETSFSLAGARFSAEEDFRRENGLASSSAAPTRAAGAGAASYAPRS